MRVDISEDGELIISKSNESGVATLIIYEKAMVTYSFISRKSGRRDILINSEQSHLTDLVSKFNALDESPPPSQEQMIDAHIGVGAEGKNHLRKYPSLICSNCRTSGINFKITKEEFERFEKLLNNNKDKQPQPSPQSEQQIKEWDLLLTPSGLAQKFHELYESLAPDFGYETRKESAVKWEDVPNKNKSLMTEVCKSILNLLLPEIQKREEEIEQERFNHNMTRIAWDRTTQERDELKNQLSALSSIKKGLEKSLTNANQTIEQQKKQIEGMKKDADLWIEREKGLGQTVEKQMREIDRLNELLEFKYANRT